MATTTEAQPRKRHDGNKDTAVAAKHSNGNANDFQRFCERAPPGTDPEVDYSGHFEFGVSLSVAWRS